MTRITYEGITMSRVLRLFTALVVVATAITVTPISAQSKAPAALPILGTWLGGVKSDSGEMQIEVSVRDEKGKLTGSISNAHGNWPIVSVTQKDDVWTIVFSRGEATDTGSMTGTITDKTLAGDWNNAPMAVGTFSVTKK
jgi:hypothetical protein